jgi:hypothetical protein
MADGRPDRHVKSRAAASGVMGRDGATGRDGTPEGGRRGIIGGRKEHS